MAGVERELGVWSRGEREMRGETVRRGGAWGAEPKLGSQPRRVNGERWIPELRWNRAERGRGGLEGRTFGGPGVGGDPETLEGHCEDRERMHPERLACCKGHVC